MGGIFGIGGSGSKTTRTNQLGSWGDLFQLFGYTEPTGMGATTSGLTNLSNAGNYFNTLMQGNRPAIAQTLAPQISTIQGQKQQSLNTLQQFSPRSGGTNAAVQSTTQEAQTAVQNLIDMLGPLSAEEVAAIGGQQAGVGLGLLGEAGSEAGTVGGQATDYLPYQVANEMATSEAAGQAVAELLSLA
jgi:hypothetical protein